jgi:hypothetical protein
MRKTTSQAPASVRLQCNHCGAHALVQSLHRCGGVCPVCLSYDIAPVIETAGDRAHMRRAAFTSA